MDEARESSVYYASSSVMPPGPQLLADLEVRKAAATSDLPPSPSVTPPASITPPATTNYTSRFKFSDAPTTPQPTQPTQPALLMAAARESPEAAKEIMRRSEEQQAAMLAKIEEAKRVLEGERGRSEELLRQGQQLRKDAEAEASKLRDMQNDTKARMARLREQVGLGTDCALC